MTTLSDEQAVEVGALFAELVRMAKDDPNVNNEDAHCWLSKEQRPRAVEIGKRLHEIGQEAMGEGEDGGFALMYFVHEEVRKAVTPLVDNPGSLVRGLEMSWDGIGSWRG